MRAQAPTIFPRSIFLLWAFCTLGLALLSPSSLTAVLVDKTGLVGDIAAGVFGLAFLLLLLDMLINEILPDRFRFTFAANYRWLFVSCMATVYWLFGTLALLPGVAPEGSWVLIVSYFGIGAWGMTFAFYTRLTRYRKEMAVHDESSHPHLA